MNTHSAHNLNNCRIHSDNYNELRRLSFSSITDLNPTPPPSVPRSPPVPSSPDTAESVYQEYQDEPFCSQVPWDYDSKSNDKSIEQIKGQEQPKPEKISYKERDRI
jgi:hypothetical protein